MGDHDGDCKELTETRIQVARLEENVRHIPELKTAVEAMSKKMDGMSGFVAGVSASVSAVITLIGLFLSWKGGIK